MDRPGVRWAIAAVIACIAVVSALVLAANRTSRPPVLIYAGTAADAAPAATAPSHGEHPPAAAPTPASSVSSTGMMYVHVAGAVKHPGLYLLPAGSRVA